MDYLCLHVSMTTHLYHLAQQQLLFPSSDRPMRFLDIVAVGTLQGKQQYVTTVTTKTAS